MEDVHGESDRAQPESCKHYQGECYQLFQIEHTNPQWSLDTLGMTDTDIKSLESLYFKFKWLFCSVTMIAIKQQNGDINTVTLLSETIWYG